MFKLLGVKTRIRIIELLKSKGPLGVKKLSEELKMTPAAISQHLKLLKQAGLVTNERKGYWIPYSIDERAMAHCHAVMSRVCACGCPGDSGFKPAGTRGGSLEDLLKYKKQLEEELKNVSKRISEIKAKE
jgi:DNA-binding transcriptional ArsR family regulator